ncbi:MAG: phosphatidylserine decarboxylase family protein [Cytophagales bacterium]|nr:phosphatidylserine decarboxylase family protein [Cytophagales bacterium]
MTIHKEGYKLLIIFFIILVVINLIVYLFVPEDPAKPGMVKFLRIATTSISVILYVLLLNFFRNPKIEIILNPNHVLAPADGKVVAIGEVNETEYFNKTRRQISIFMSPLNVHINRNPVSGTIKYFKYHPGNYLVAWHPKSSAKNERTTVVYETENKHQILVRQIAGAVARRISCYVKQGDVVKQGDELGFIKFGSRLDVLLPLDAKLNIKIGDKTVGGETVIAEL